LIFLKLAFLLDIKSPIPEFPMEQRLLLCRLTEEAFPNGEEPLTVSFFDVSDCGPAPGDVTPGNSYHDIGNNQEHRHAEASGMVRKKVRNNGSRTPLKGNDRLGFRIHN
jgi:hypothetical protein